MLMVHRINYPNSLCAGNSRRVAAAVVVSAAAGGVVLKLSETITIVECEQMNNSVATKLMPLLMIITMIRIKKKSNANLKPYFTRE